MSDVDEQKVIGQEKAETTKLEAQQNVAAKEYSKENRISDKLMGVKVSSPYVTYFDNQAFSISAENPSGPFDILPGHHNFISLLTACMMIVRSKDGNEQKINISGGIMHVKADKVIVFLDV